MPSTFSHQPDRPQREKGSPFLQPPCKAHGLLAPVAALVSRSTEIHLPPTFACILQRCLCTRFKPVPAGVVPIFTAPYSNIDDGGIAPIFTGPGAIPTTPCLHRTRAAAKVLFLVGDQLDYNDDTVQESDMHIVSTRVGVQEDWYLIKITSSGAADTRTESGQDDIGGSSEAVRGRSRPASRAGRADRKNTARSSYNRQARSQIGEPDEPERKSPASRSGRVRELAGDVTWASW